MGQSVPHKISTNKLHDLASSMKECITSETTGDSLSEWYRLASNLGINNIHANNIDIYKEFQMYIKTVTNGKYSRIRSYQDLDDEGKRLLQLILDYESNQRLDEIIDDQNGTDTNIKLVIGVASAVVVGACVVVGGAKYLKIK